MKDKRDRNKASSNKSKIERTKEVYNNNSDSKHSESYDDWGRFRGEHSDEYDLRGYY